MRHRVTILEDLRIPPWKHRDVPWTVDHLRAAVDQLRNIGGDVEVTLASHPGLSVGYDLIAEWDSE